MISFHNISAVAKYESRLLGRGWFFKIFTLLSILPLGITSLSFLNSFRPWILVAIPANIPYFNMLLINVGQAIIAIFLASEFIKRDTKLDTSEVFFVKPMSNTEYVIGKTWGSLRMFISLNFAALLIAFIFNSLIDYVWIDWGAYLFYFMAISIPTLVFVVGLSYFLMILLKNQAVVFALLLAYIAITLFYIGDSVYYLFDYMGFNLPLMKSDIVGHVNLIPIILHRSIYLFLGIAFIAMTIYKLPRLANNKNNTKYVLITAILFFLGAGVLVLHHISSFYMKSNARENFLAINNKYSGYAKIAPDSCFINLNQMPRSIEAEMVFNGKTLEGAKEYVFSLNPGLTVNSVTSKSHKISFIRDNQVILVAFDKELKRGENVDLKFNYKGNIDQNYCYLDVSDKDLAKTNSVMLFNIEKSYAFITPKYLLLTPETAWYPKQGVSYSPENPTWSQSHFTKYRLEVTALDSLVAVSQGKDTIIDGKYIFEPDRQLMNISLAIGDYEKFTMKIDTIDYSMWMIKNHDYFTQTLDSLKDTLSVVIPDIKGNIERSRNLTYPFNRFGLVEVPANFETYPRLWTKAQESVQPELVFVCERAYDIGRADIHENLRWMREYNKNGWLGRDHTDFELQLNVLRNLIYYFNDDNGEYKWSMKAGGSGTLEVIPNKYKIYPQLFNFRVNLFSSELAFANRLLEQYVDPDKSSRWMRNINGITVEEKANLLFKESSFRDLMYSDNKELTNAIVTLKSAELFMPGELKIGRDEFRDSVFSYINRNSFQNIDFERMMLHFEDITDWDFKEDYSMWLDSVYCPGYEISEPIVSYFNNGDEDVYETVFKIHNVSDIFGMLRIEVREQQNQTTNDYFYVDAGNMVERVIITNTQPVSFEITTNISTNIPSTLSFRAGNVTTVVDREPKVADTYNVNNLETKGVIIVDNEDPGFSISESEPIGLLATWILKEDDGTGLDFVGYNIWRPPLKWSKTTAPRYYGRNVRSVHFLKSGKGNAWAQWNIPIEEEGQYDLYYWVAGYDEVRWMRWKQAKYQFFVNAFGEEPDEYTLNLRRNDQGWALLGTFYAGKGDFTVKLTNNTKLNAVEADAVKLVKR